MTDEEKYINILKALAELLYQQDRKLSMKDYEINKLRNQLESAEDKITK